MPKRAPSPRVLREDLAEIVSLAHELVGEVKDMEAVAYGRPPAPDGLGDHSDRPTVDKDGNPLVNPLTRSDPTGVAALGNAHVKHQYARAGKAIKAAKTEMLRARSAFKQAIAAADHAADRRDPEGIYGPPPPPATEEWQVSEDELKDLQRRKAERDEEAGDDLCHTCRAQPIFAKNECGACWKYRRRTGQTRPERLINHASESRRRRGMYETRRPSFGS